jgi:Cupin superfamily (DUF985)
MANQLTADEIRSLLKLEPNATCGYVRETYLSRLSIAPGGLPAPFADGRPLGSALYFMMSPAAPVKLHRIKNHQLYHHYLGDPIEVLMLHDAAPTRWRSSAQTSAPASACSSSSPATPSTPRASSVSAAGSWARAPNGRASSQPRMWNSATLIRSPRAIPTSPPRSAASLCPRVSR